MGFKENAEAFDENGRRKMMAKRRGNKAQSVQTPVAQPQHQAHPAMEHIQNWLNRR